MALIVSLLPTYASASEIQLPVHITRAGVIVRAEAGMESLAKRVARIAPSALSEIYEDLDGLRRPPRIEIRLVKRSADIGRAAPPGRGAPQWAAGVAYSDVGVVVIATRRGPDSIDVESTLRHELAHLALDAALGNRAPRWLHEGFAYLHSSDWNFARMRTLTGMAWTGDVIPLSQMQQRFPAREDQAARAYAQSYDFVVFLARRGRSASSDDDGDRWAFRTFLAALGEGSTMEEATSHAFRASPDGLFSEWYEDLRSRYLVMPVGLFSLFIWVFAAFLLVIGYIRKRRQNRRRLAEWEIEEAAAQVDVSLTSEMTSEITTEHG